MELIFITLTLMLIVAGVLGFISLRQSAKNLSRMYDTGLWEFMGTQMRCAAVYLVGLSFLVLFFYKFRFLLEENPLGEFLKSCIVLGFVPTFVCLVKVLVNLVKASIRYNKIEKKY